MAGKKRLHCLVACLAVSLSGCGTVATPSQPEARTYLSAEELKALLSQTRTVRITVGNTRALGIYSQNGNAQLDWGTGSTRGNWRLEGDKFCSKYQGLRRGYEECYRFSKVSADTYRVFNLEGTGSSTWVIEK